MMAKIKKLFKRKKKQEADVVAIDFSGKDTGNFKPLPKIDKREYEEYVKKKHSKLSQIQKSSIVELPVTQISEEDREIIELEQKLKEAREKKEFERKQQELAKLEAEKRSLQELAIRKAEEKMMLEELRLSKTISQGGRKCINTAPPILNKLAKSQEIVNVPSEEVKVELTPFNDELMKNCPMCNSKIQKGKVFFKDGEAQQVIKCKNPSCIFVKVFRVDF